jgi:hypothetical protein
MTIKHLISGLAVVASIGFVGGISSTVLATTASSPTIGTAPGSTALHPTTQRVTIAGTGTGTVEMESVGTATGARVSARLVAGIDASVQGYDVSRNAIANCFARDTSTGAGAVLSPVGTCAGVRFKDLFVFN